jgi:hypothetical protein
VRERACRQLHSSIHFICGDIYPRLQNLNVCSNSLVLVKEGGEGVGSFTMYTPSDPDEAAMYCTLNVTATFI